MNNATLLIKTVEDIRWFIGQLCAMDVEAESSMRGPNTHWRLFALTNLTVYICKHPGMQRVRVGGAALPAKLMRNKSILLLSARNAMPFDDNVCFSRCLAVNRLCVCPCNRCICNFARKTKVQTFFRKYAGAMGKTLKNFDGIDEHALLEWERIYDVEIREFKKKLLQTLASFLLH